MPDSGDLWAVAGVRFTAFLHGDSRPDPANWWTLFTGEPSESVTKTREGRYEETGRFLGGRLVLQVQPFRMDWNLLPDMSDEKAPQDSPPVLGGLEFVKSSTQAVLRWVPNAPPVNRLAVGLSLVLPLEDRAAGYRALAEYLEHLDVDIEGSRDLFYQINRPRRSRCMDDLEINRLSQWSVMQTASFSVQVAPLGSPAVATGPFQSQVRLSLDMSTAAQRTETLPHESIEALLRELVDLGLEIARKGDIA